MAYHDQCHDHHHHHYRSNHVSFRRCCSIFFGTFGAFCLSVGTIMMATGYDSSSGFGVGSGTPSGIPGTVLLCLGAGLVTACCVLCYCASKKQRESTVVNRQVAGGATLGYGQPDGTQPQPPPGTVAYGAGGGPIASQAAHPGVTIAFDPLLILAGFRPQPQRYPNQPYPATAALYTSALAGVPYPLQPVVPYPPQPVTELAGQPEPPPPSYDEVTKTQSVAVHNNELPTT